jgi:hypothetical protein
MNRVIGDLYFMREHRRWAFDVAPDVVFAVRKNKEVIHFSGCTFFVKNSCAPTRVHADVRRQVEGGA